MGWRVCIIHIDEYLLFSFFLSFSRDYLVCAGETMRNKSPVFDASVEYRHYIHL